MERRKIMQLGRSSLVISLPKAWIKAVNLKPGDTVSVSIEKDNSLVIFPDDSEEPKEKKITLFIGPEDNRETISRAIIACYLNGYTYIKLIAKKIFTRAQQKAIRRAARLLYIRIIDADAKNVLMTTLIEESKTSVISNIRRMHTISLSMCKDVFNAYINKDIDLARTVYSLDDDVDQFCFFILRILRTASNDPLIAKKLELTPLDCQDYQLLAYRIEQIADCAAHIADTMIYMRRNNLEIPEHILEPIYISGNKAVDAYDKAVEGFFKGDISDFEEIQQKQKEVLSFDQGIASKTFLTHELKPMTVCAICSIRDAIKRIAEWAVAIAENNIIRSYAA